MRDEDGSASTVGGSRLYISEDAIEGLPAEFRERARLVSSDEELNALIKDVAMGNP